MIFQEIKQWADEREINSNGFNLNTFILNILEELIESSTNLQSEQARKTAETLQTQFLNKSSNITEEQIVDSINDIIVFSTNALLQLGYDPDKTLKEVLKELNSRTQDPEQKKRWQQGKREIGEKWKKDINAKKYSANFQNCKLETQDKRKSF